MTRYRWVGLAIAITGGAAIAMGLYFFLTDPARADGFAPEAPGASVAALFAEHPELEEVWHFDNASKSYDIYVRAIEPKTLRFLIPGEPYLFIVSDDVTVQGHRLSCRDEFCLNIIAWEARK